MYFLKTQPYIEGLRRLIVLAFRMCGNKHQLDEVSRKDIKTKAESFCGLGYTRAYSAAAHPLNTHTRNSHVSFSTQHTQPWLPGNRWHSASCPLCPSFRHHHNTTAMTQTQHKLHPPTLPPHKSPSALQVSSPLRGRKRSLPLAEEHSQPNRISGSAVVRLCINYGLSSVPDRKGVGGERERAAVKSGRGR